MPRADQTDPRRSKILDTERCQHCAKPKSQVPNMMRCACGDVYCDQTCQRSDWKFHRELCQKRRATPASTSNEQISNDLRLWSRYWNEKLYETSILAHNFVKDPKTASESMLIVSLKRTSETDHAKVDKFFDLVEIELHPPERLSKILPAFSRANQKEKSDEAIAKGYAGVLSTMLFIHGETTCLHLAHPIPKQATEMAGRMPPELAENWADKLKDAIAKGITTSIWTK